MPLSILSKLRAPLAIAVAIAVTGAVAWAYWTIGAAAGSTGGAAAATVNQGATPTVNVTAIGREISVSWGTSTLSNGNAVSGYLVKRYPSGGGVPTISPVGSCSGTVATTSCNEDDVPTGTWVYTVTPIVASWHGAESATSGVVTVAAATLTLNGSPFGDAAFTPTANATGAIAGFAGGENLTYRLDTGTSLTGSPTSVGTDGKATITSLGIPRSAGDGAHTVSALGDAAYVPSSASAGIVIDTTAPTVSAQLGPSPNAAGWNNTSPVSVALSADDNGGSGVAQVRYTTDGSDPTTSGTAQVYSGSPFDVSSEGTTTVKYVASDVAGNVSPVQTQLVKIDTSPPLNSVSLTSVTGGVYPTTGPLTDGSTVYYRGAASGSFRITNAVSDAVSGAASSETGPLAGGSSGWSHTPSLVNTPAGGPYVANAFSWNAGTGASPAETVTGRDVADNVSNTTLNFADDSTGPSGGSVDATGLAGSGGRYATSTTLNISFSKGADSASGVAATGAMLLRASATLSSDGLADGTCGAFGSFSQIGSGDPTSPYTDDAAGGISSGHCYRYEYVVADNVGNSTTYGSGDVKVDTTGPSAPSVTLSSATGNSYISGSTVYINSQAGKSGSFQASATSSDSDSGILKLSFPSPAGFSSGGGDDTISPFTSGTYNWAGAVAASGAQTVTATNNANLTSTTSFTITPDTTNPTGGALTVNGTAATNSGTTSYSNSGSFNINALSDYTDSGSGVASSTLVRESAPLASGDGIADGSCGSFGATTAIGGPAPVSQTLPGPGCYRYTLTGTDKVGNTISISTTVKVDTTGPSAPSVTLSSATGNSYISGSTVYINSQAGKSGSFQASATSSDSDSGILKLSFPSPAGFSSGGGDDTISPFTSGTYNWAGAVAASGAQTVTATNNANLTSTTSFTITPDTTNPTGGALTVNGTAATNSGTTSYSNSGSFNINALSDYTDSGSGVASSTLVRESAPLASGDGIADGSCGSFGATTAIGGPAPVSQTLPGPGCYRYTLTGTDKVGNTISISTTVKVDTTGPSAPSVTLSSATGNSYISGSTVYINSQAGKSGSFQASATSSDSDSGILKLSFPSPAGFSSGGGDDTISPFTSGTYNWAGAVAASGAQTVTATNNANLTSTTSFTITPDTTNPTGGALTVNGTAATNSGTTSSTTDPNFAINSRTNYSDGGSGIGSSTLTIQSETLTGNSCGAPGSGGPYTSPTTVSGTTNPSITVGYCYLYTLTGTDNVGNTSSISTVVKASFAGIDWTAITTSNNRTVSCNYTTITAVTCSVTGVGQGGTFTAKVELIDASHNPVNNTTGGTLTVSQTTTGQGGGSPASTTVAPNASSSAGSFTVTLGNGNNKTAMITASITVGGVTYTVNCQVST